jgi:hypothetical protein
VYKKKLNGKEFIGKKIYWEKNLLGKKLFKNLFYIWKINKNFEFFYSKIFINKKLRINIYDHEINYI